MEDGCGRTNSGSELKLRAQARSLPIRKPRMLHQSLCHLQKIIHCPIFIKLIQSFGTSVEENSQGLELQTAINSVHDFGLHTRRLLAVGPRM